MLRNILIVLVLISSNLSLMVLDFRKGITSYSWEGEESWTSKVLKDSIYLFGQGDTLYGVFNEQMIILSSTLDDRPTEYHSDKDIFQFETEGSPSTSLMND